MDFSMWVDDLLMTLNDLPIYVLQPLKLCIWLALITVIFLPMERLFALHPQKIFRKAILTDVGYYFLSALLPSLLLGVPMAYVAWGARHFIPAGFTSTVEGLPPAVRIVAAMVVGEIGFYWGHRWSHEIPLLWRFHAVHHSAEHIDYLVSARAHPVDMIFTRLCGLVPMYVLGLASPTRGSSGWIPVVVLFVGTFWGFFIHANVRWRFGPLEWLISTPAFHHWHHTNDGPEVINKNYAPMLPWMDKVFGTMYLPKGKHPQRYGIDEPIAPTLVGQLIEPFVVRRKVLQEEDQRAGERPAR